MNKIKAGVYRVGLKKSDEDGWFFVVKISTSESGLTHLQHGWVNEVGDFAQDGYSIVTLPPELAVVLVTDSNE